MADHITRWRSQLKHLIQLTEYVTACAIGYPNEHLAAGHIDWIGQNRIALVLFDIKKGYNIWK
jgi:cell division protein FtsA